MHTMLPPNGVGLDHLQSWSASALGVLVAARRQSRGSSVQDPRLLGEDWVLRRIRLQSFVDRVLTRVQERSARGARVGAV